MPVVEQPQAFGVRRARLVGEVVGPAGEGVDGGNRGAHPARQQERGHRKVLVMTPRDPGAPSIRAIEIGATRRGRALTTPVQERRHVG